MKIYEKPNGKKVYIYTRDELIHMSTSVGGNKGFWLLWHLENGIGMAKKEVAKLRKKAYNQIKCTSGYLYEDFFYENCWRLWYCSGAVRPQSFTETDWGYIITKAYMFEVENKEDK